MTEHYGADYGDIIASGRGTSTPDATKMTKRQRSTMDKAMHGELLQLPSGRHPLFVQTTSNIITTSFLQSFH